MIFKKKSSFLFSKDNNNYNVIVQLMGSRRFNVGTITTQFPLCSYDFECDSSSNFTRLKLKEVGCINRLNPLKPVDWY